MSGSEEVDTSRTPKKKKDDTASEDIAFGQYVVVTARWILVAAGLLLSLWNTAPDPAAVLEQMKFQFIVLVLLAGGNFYLNLQLLRRRPAVGAVAYLASAADIAVITALVYSQGGFASPLYIFYFPALLAIAVAFPRPATLAYTAVALFAYSAVDVPVTAVPDQQALLARIAMLAAVAFCGHLYFTIEHDRRRDAARARESLSAALGER